MANLFFDTVAVYFLQVVEEVIRQTPVYSEAELSWRNMTSCVAQMIISVITGCFHLCNGINILKTEALYCGGKCLRLLSLHTNMDSANRWNVDTGVSYILPYITGLNFIVIINKFEFVEIAYKRIMV